MSSALRSAAAVTSVSGAACTKFPPRPMKILACPSRNARIALTVSKPSSRGGSRPNSACSRSRKFDGRRLTDAHRAVALHVGVATHRQQPSAWLPDVALRQRQVDDLADSGHCVVMLRQAHGPAEHRLIGLAEQLGCLGDLCTREACGCLTRFQSIADTWARQSSKPRVCRAMKS